jgi:signal transduction histidine kinase
LESRAQSLQNAVELNFENIYKNRPSREQVVVGPLRPVWLDKDLVLARRVLAGGQEIVQGCWLDWPGLQRWLLGNLRDLLPNATLQPITGNTSEVQGRALASLPVRLVPGAAVSGFARPSTAILTALILGWGCVLLAGAAMAALLHGTLALSERRAAFVSAVTHELRTPLTTFKMYAEMLSDGMVPDENKRQEYLLQMCSEADRLHHLVENVLAYARLERGSARRRTERVTLSELMQRVKPRLEQRAAQASMMIREAADPGALATVVEVDVSAVEQILFNLVDNACKYAAPFSEDKTIYLEAVAEGGKSALVRIRDSGRGISAEAAERLFQPFSKSAQQAAGNVPGVGLGLALCRNLGRSMGGELRLGREQWQGSMFRIVPAYSLDSLFPQRHQAKMQEHPDRKRKGGNHDHPIP